MKYFVKRSGVLADYLLADNPKEVLQAARSMPAREVSGPGFKRVIIDISDNSKVIKEATIELLSDETYGKYGLFKARGEYYSSALDLAEALCVSLPDATWSAHRFTQQPSRVSDEELVKWARSPNVSQASIDVSLDNIVYLGRGSPMNAPKGRLFMEVCSERLVPVKTFLTPSEMRYISRLHSGQ
jgi:hypothetical protein